MLRLISAFLIAAAATATTAAHADPNATNYDIVSVDVREVLVTANPPVAPPECSGVAKPSPYDIGLGDILTIGTKLWQIITENKPVVTITTPVVSALPRGVTCWTDLQQWQPPKVKAYSVSYKNLFGAEPVRFDFNLHYSYGGNREGVGQYLANVTVLPTNLKVDWGYTFDATVEAESAINIGTTLQPIAGQEINVKWTVKTPIQETHSTIQFFVSGDGQANEVQ